MKKRPRFMHGAMLALALALSAAASAQRGPVPGYPVKPIRVLVGFTPGGATDAIARIIGHKMGESWGQQVVVDNRGGAGGNIAAEMAAKATPDGYTLLMASASLTINAALYSKLPFDPARDYAAVTQVTSSPFLVVIHPSVPAQSVRELVAFARSQPGKLTYGSGGASSHLAGELFKSIAGIEMVHVPYKSSGPAVTDLLGGQIQLMFSAPPAALPHVKTGKLRLLAVTSKEHLPAAPDVPTVAESGLEGYEVSSWSGLLVPAATPKHIVAKLNVEVVRIMQRPEVQERLPALGLIAVTSTPEQFDAFFRADRARWKKLAQEKGIRAE